MKIGIIGGSGLYELDDLRNVETKELATPFGRPSDAFICGVMGDNDVYFLPRHGRGHVLLPSEINHRANIFGFKMLGAESIISVSAVGSLKEDLRPRDIVLPDQYFDRTKNSTGHTFFGDGIVAHISFAEPTCGKLRKCIAETARRVIKADSGLDVGVNEGGTYVNMEGPAFSTRAESHVYRQFGMDIIGMTSLPEAKLCREAGICYQPLAMVTDYDCWRETESAVTVDMVIEHLTANTKLAKEILVVLLTGGFERKQACDCSESLQHAILTNAGSISEETKKRMNIIVGKYV